MTRRAAAALLLALSAVSCRNPQRASSPATGGDAQNPEAPDRPEEKGVPPEPGRPQIPASPEALLAPGAVKEIQRTLTDRGFLGAHRAGELDDPTSRALRKFQESQELAATGFPDRETLQKLGVDPERAYGREEGAGSD